MTKKYKLKKYLKPYDRMSTEHMLFDPEGKLEDYNNCHMIDIDKIQSVLIPDIVNSIRQWLKMHNLHIDDSVIDIVESYNFQTIPAEITRKKKHTVMIELSEIGSITEVNSELYSILIPEFLTSEEQELCVSCMFNILTGNKLICRLFRNKFNTN